MSKRISLSAIMLLILTVSVAGATDDDWLTYFERSNFQETPRYEEVVAFCGKLAAYSPYVRFTDFGVSPQGRKLPLLILDKDSEFDAKGAKTAHKVILLIQAGIHAGEIEGKDAGLMLFRDIAVRGKYRQILDSVVILFIPIFNVDGHERFGPYNRINQNGPKEMGWRTTAQNLNLNRDFAKADSPEMQGWLKLFHEWMPDLLVDVHTTDGADCQYVITCGLETNANVASPLAEWCERQFMPEMEEEMEKSGCPLGPYVNPRRGHDVTSGLMTWVAPPRFSNGYGAAQNRPFFLVETHMLKSYRQRVESTYELLRNLAVYSSKNATQIRRTMREADSVTASGMVGTYFPLSFRPGEDSVMIDFAGVGFHFERSPISDTMRIVWEDRKETYKVPYFGRNAAVDSVLVPYAYLIPREWSRQIDLLRLHGVKVDYLAKDMNLMVESYRFIDPKWEEEPFEGWHELRIQTSSVTEKRLYPAGSAVVLMNQRTNRMILHLLEPRSPDSFVSWGFFDAIFEQKEYAEDYVLEEMAAKMLDQDPALKREFEEKLATDTAFAKSPEQRLDFFYQRSPYWDQQIGVYPVGKLTTATKLPLVSPPDR